MTPWLHRLALLALCAAYLQGGFNKLMDLPGAIAEAQHFALPFPSVTAVATLALELGASALILAGWWRRPAAVALGLFTLAASLIANRYWALPPGEARFMMANAFFEHIGLVGGFALVALWPERSA